MISDYAKRCGIDLHITPHMFRHTFATALMDENVNIRYIQQLLGHSSITTTQIYTHISTNKIRHILEGNHPRNKISILFSVPQNLPLMINFMSNLYEFVSVFKRVHHTVKSLYLCGFRRK